MVSTSVRRLHVWLNGTEAVDRGDKAFEGLSCLACLPLLRELVLEQSAIPGAVYEQIIYNGRQGPGGWVRFGDADVFRYIAAGLASVTSLRSVRSSLLWFSGNDDDAEVAAVVAMFVALPFLEDVGTLNCAPAFFWSLLAATKRTIPLRRLRMMYTDSVCEDLRGDLLALVRGATEVLPQIEDLYLDIQILNDELSPVEVAQILSELRASSLERLHLKTFVTFDEISDEIEVHNCIDRDLLEREIGRKIEVRVESECSKEWDDATYC